MPYCCQCGKGVTERDVYCAFCGARQPLATNAATEYINGITPRTASLLSYILFVAWLIIDLVLSPLLIFGYWGAPHMPHLPLGGLLKLLIFGTWIYMMVKVSHDDNVKLPILGELAEKSVSEQR